MDKESNNGSRNTPDNMMAEPVIIYKRRRVWGYWLVMILLLAACVMTGVALFNTMDTADYYRRQAERNGDESRNAAAEIATLRDSLSAIHAERSSLMHELQSFRSHVGESYPLIINAVEFCNVEDNGNVLTSAGSTLYADKIKYLRPILKYEGLAPGRKKFFVKFFRPDGTLLDGTSSPSGYSYSSEYEVEEGSGHSLVFSGWGNSNGGSYRTGTYRVEIWCDSKCLKTASVSIH